jgi:hypothetical protein
MSSLALLEAEKSSSLYVTGKNNLDVFFWRCWWLMMHFLYLLMGWKQGRTMALIGRPTTTQIPAHMDDP